MELGGSGVSAVTVATATGFSKVSISRCKDTTLLRSRSVEIRAIQSISPIFHRRSRKQTRKPVLSFRHAAQFYPSPCRGRPKGRPQRGDRQPGTQRQVERL